jgi:hypothetical protein
MATNQTTTNGVSQKETTASPTTSRQWMEFALIGYARICARKHGLAPPTAGLDHLSDEEIEQRLALVRDLAHLPPG